VAIGETEGFVKIIGDQRHGEILGAHIFGADATELIAEIALAKATEMTVDDLHHTVHSHPTLSESVMEAAGDWKGEAVQI
jgi:dihydrolipoamide dehydrogenase